MLNARLLISGIFGFSAVAFGAFGAHALGLEGASQKTYDTASSYHLTHAIVMTALALVIQNMNPMGAQKSRLQRAFLALGVGTIIFSGSLYTLVISGQKFWGAITPIGGVLLLVGWLHICWAGAAKS